MISAHAMKRLPTAACRAFEDPIARKNEEQRRVNTD